MKNTKEIYHSEQRIVERFITLYNAFQIDSMLELFTDDCFFQNISNNSGITECHGKQELALLARQSAALFSARTQTVSNWIISEDKVAVEIDYQATIAQDLPNGFKQGQIINLKGISIYELENGKIKRLADFS